MKACTLCNTVLPFSAFYARRQSRDGYQPCCKTCQAARYSTPHKAKLRRARGCRLWSQVADQAAERAAQRAAERKAKHDALLAWWEWLTFRAPSWWLEAYQEPMREKQRASFRKRYVRLIEQERERSTRFKHANPDKVARWKGKRGELASAQSDGTLTPDILSALFAASVACCYCNEPFGRSVKRTLDHIVPLSRGGAHSLGNAAICCETCNSSKGAKLLSEWRRRGRAAHVLQHRPHAGHCGAQAF